MRTRTGCFTVLFLTFQCYIAAEELEDSLRDVRELFLNDGIENVDNKVDYTTERKETDPIRGLQSFVEKVIR